MNEKKMNEVVKFLREEREKRKISQGQLSYKSGISVSIISKIEQGLRNPTINTVLSMGKALGIDVLILLEKMNVITESDIEKHLNMTLKKKIEEEIENISSVNQTTIPVYNSVSAGLGRVAESIPIDYLSLPIKCPESCVGIKVSGDSMSPTITDGAIIILKKEIEVLDREIGVFLLNDEAYVKRIIRKDKLLLLYSDNFLYEPIIVTEKDNFAICGKVIETLNKL